MFHLCSHGSRDIGDRAKPRLEGAHAVLRWLSRGHEVDPAMRLSEAARSGDALLLGRDVVQRRLFDIVIQGGIDQIGEPRGASRTRLP